MAGSYILYNKLHYNGLMTDLGLIFIARVTLVTAKINIAVGRRAHIRA